MDGDTLRFRLEVLKRGRRFVGQVLRWEFFRIQPTFPQRKSRPAHRPCDEMVLVRDDTLFDDLTGASIARVVDKFFDQLSSRFQAR